MLLLPLACCMQLRCAAEEAVSVAAQQQLPAQAQQLHQQVAAQLQLLAAADELPQLSECLRLALSAAVLPLQAVRLLALVLQQQHTSQVCGCSAPLSKLLHGR